MEYLWKKFEEEFNAELSQYDRDYIVSMGVREFLEKNLRYYDLNGCNYTKNPEKFREELLRRMTNSYLIGKRRRNHEPTTGSEPDT